MGGTHMEHVTQLPITLNEAGDLDGVYTYALL